VRKFQGNGGLSGVGCDDGSERLHIAGNFGGDFVFGDFEVVAGLGWKVEERRRRKVAATNSRSAGGGCYS